MRSQCQSDSGSRSSTPITANHIGHSRGVGDPMPANSTTETVAPLPQPHHPNGLASTIHTARLRVRMSIATLARHAGLSESTIKNLERGRDTSPQTLRAVLSVRELGLSDELAALHIPTSAQPNAWYAPGFSPVAEFKAMLA